MSWPHRLTTPLLVASLVLPVGATSAQDDVPRGWSVSPDGLALATNDTFDQLPTWRQLQPGEFPPAISGIPGPERLYHVDRTVDTGTRVARVLDADALTWLEEGRTPLLATAIVDDDGASWARRQHIVSMPAGCPAELPDCRLPELFAGLSDLAAPGGTPVEPIFGDAPLEPGTISGTAIVQQDGTLFSFGGDASVGTTVRLRDDGTVVVQGEASIGSGLGGRLRGYDAFVVDAADARSIEEILRPLGRMEDRARAVRDRGADDDGVNRRVVGCPRSGEGYAVSQFLLNGLGRNVGPAVDPGLEGGVATLVTDIVYFECDVRSDPALSVGDAAAAFACGSTRAVHQPFTSNQGGRQVTSNSTLAQQWALVTLGFSSDTTALLSSAISDANGGELFTVDLEGVRLDSTSHPDAVLWLGASKVGIDTYGPKRFRDLQLTVDGITFDLSEAQRAAVGDAFDVGPSQQPVTNCPGFGFEARDVDVIFGDGFESGDVSAWSSPTAD